MRRVFENCGFFQEAQHRRAWRVNGGVPVDAVGYAILRDEWERR
jgi:RimJ/RimL family protein N-acetyltransferase